MIPNRESPAFEPNELLEALPPQEGEGNADWFARSPIREGILLLGGSSLADFRLRVAQSQLRRDVTPSYWSLSGLVREDGSFSTVPLQFPDVSDVPRTNAVQVMSIEEVDDPVRWPNIAVLRFSDDHDFVEAYAARVAHRRTIVDLPELIVAWLGFVWATGEARNPLLSGSAVPSAAFVEAAHSLAGIELTPGLSSSASCPEAMWQGVKWWHEYYAGTLAVSATSAAGPRIPSGRYGVRQPSAAVELPRKEPIPAPEESPAEEAERA
jgi:hypothetical protein